MSYKNSISVGIDQIEQVVDILKGQILNKNIIVLLKGELASGKTTLVKHFVNSIGINEIVTSPTFLIQTIYGDNIFHYDIYNKSLDEFIALGMLEELDKPGIHFVEWGDEKLEKILNQYGFEILKITINKLYEKREYIIES